MKWLLAVMILLAPGCALVENAMKAGVEMGFNAATSALDNKWSGWRDTVADEMEGTARDLAGKAVEEACAYTDGKVKELADARIKAYEEKTGIDVSVFDVDGDGKLSFSEAYGAFALVNKESEEREERGEDPIPWTTRYGETALIAFLALMGYGGAKLGGKKLANVGAKAVKKIANGGGNG